MTKDLVGKIARIDSGVGEAMVLLEQRLDYTG